MLVNLSIHFQSAVKLKMGFPRLNGFKIFDLNSARSGSTNLLRSPKSNLGVKSLLPNNLFETILVFDTFYLDSQMKRLDDQWSKRSIQVFESTNFPMTLYGHAESELLLRIAYNRRLFKDQTIEQILKHLENILEEVSRNPDKKLGQIELLSEGRAPQDSEILE